MSTTIAIVTGGLRGLGRAMSLGLLGAGYRVTVVGHSADDVPETVGLAGWGRVVNVTTKPDTMNRAGSSPHGRSKAALEMATEIWARELVGTGVTVNIVNPGAGANAPGMAAEMRARSAAGSVPALVEPEDMVAPLLVVVSRAADGVNGFRFDANNWQPGRDAATMTRPAGLALHPEAGWTNRNSG